jgi:hypothetical protein
MVGLIPLQNGIYFWMNNGASGYGDYSTYRAKSMRRVISEYGWLMPPELFTFANYPHNDWPFFAQRYNINSSLIGGRGIWGNLASMKAEQRERAGKVVEKSKRIIPYIKGIPLKYSGKVGSTIETYSQINKDTAAGQFIAFSGQAANQQVQLEVMPDHLLGVINHNYNLKHKYLLLDLQFTTPDDTREAFILTNNGKGVTVFGSSCWLDNITLNNNALTITTGTAGIQKIKWSKKFGKPEVTDQNIDNFTIKENETDYSITVIVNQATTYTIHSK